MGASIFAYVAALAMALKENCCTPDVHICCLAGRMTEVFAFLAGSSC